MTNKEIGGAPAEPHGRRARPKGRRGWLAAAAAAVVVAVAAGTVYALGLGGSEEAAGNATPLPPATAQITKETLRDTQTLDGELGYGPTTAAISRINGTVTWLPDSGDVIRRGRSLYRIDDKPIVLMYGTLTAYRDLAPGVEGRDVKQLESNLKALGYSGFTVDDEYDWETAEAVQEWQEDRGLEETGRVELGRVVFRPGAVRAEGVEAVVGQPAQQGRTLFTYTGTKRVITVVMDVDDQRMAKKNAKVQIELPDGKEVKGKIDEVYTVIEAADGSPDSEDETKIEAIVSMTNGKAAAGLDAAAVDVVFTASTKKNVLTVPISALVALSEGGYGVEVVAGGTSRFVPVKTGLFADGKVEVTGEGLAEGMTVGMPQ
ncbi:efflux RND transporter periplasmic adaptor subunit [Sinosporangium siamense]|uniref:Peptidoglycan-binding protein n=1 Tax=Sinosporangium siamense TaxID=1367973 RepID=A0A919RJJ1_9ACTN|nr:peptidoglycan-binding protein [Sinosporangium siamense]GII94963.1 peptidoglycan-binding protein [Sinosporangium siamense]